MLRFIPRRGGNFALALVCAVLLCPLVTNAPARAAVDADRSDRFYKSAVRELNAGDVPAAIIELRNALQRDPGNLDARILLGRLRLLTGDPVSAEKELSIVLRKRQDDGAEVLLGDALLLMQRYRDALERVGETATEPDATIAKRRIRSFAALSLGDLEQAEREAAAILDIDQTAVEGLFARAQIAATRGNLDAALTTLDDLLANGPAYAPAWMLRGELLMRRGDPDGAIDAFSRFIELQPAGLSGYVARGRARLYAGDVAGAKADAQRVATVAPNAPMAAYLTAAVALAQDDVRAANAAYSRFAQPLGRFAPALLLGAMIKHRTGEVAQAQTLLGRYVEADPANRAARRAYGLISLEVDSPRAALDALEPLARETPYDLGVLQGLASAYLRLGAYAKAEAVYARLRQLGRPDVARQALAAQSLLCTQESSAALSLCGGPLGDDTGRDVLRALDYLDRGAPDRAEEIARTLLDRVPDNEIVQTTLASALTAQERFDEARKILDALLAKNPNATNAADLLARIDTREGRKELTGPRLAALADANKNNPRLALRAAQHHARQGDTDGATALLQKTAAAHPGDLPVVRALAAQLAKAGRAQEVALSVDRYLSVAGRTPTTLKGAIGVFTDAGQTREALALIDDLRLVAPDTRESWQLEAKLLLSLGQRPQALAALRDGLAALPGDVRLAEDASTLALATGNVAAATEIAATLKETAPTAAARLEAQALGAAGQAGEAAARLAALFDKRPNAELAAALYRARRTAGDTDGAVAGLQAWIADNPDDLVANALLASHHLEHGALDAAETLYLMLVENSPGDAALLNNLAWVRNALGRPDALDLARSALEMAPTSPNIADTYGWMLAERGQLTQALPILKQAHALAPANPTIAYHYAAALARNGARATALRIIGTALDSGRGFRERTDAIALRDTLNQQVETQ